MANNPKKSLQVAHIPTDKIKKIWSDAFTKNTISQKLPYKKYIYAAIAIDVLLTSAVLALSYFNRLPPEVPLFYGQPEGEQMLASNWALVLPALSSVTFLGVNCIFAYFTKDDYLKKTLILSGILLSFLAMITTLEIIWLVGNI